MEDDDEDEEEVTIKGGGFAVREGQRVSVIRVSSRPNWGYNIAYYNHKTGTAYAPDYRLAWPLDKKPSRKPAPFAADRTSVGEGKSEAVSDDLGGRRITKKKNKYITN